MRDYMMSFRLLLCLLICVSCSSQTTQEKSYIEGDQSTDQPNNASSILYVFENDTIKQTVELSNFNNKEIAFKLVSHNKFRKLETKVEGVGKIKEGDLEYDVDIEGNAYLVNVFVFDDDCWLNFRIDKETSTKMVINEADCSLKNIYCPLHSINMLARQ